MIIVPPLYYVHHHPLELEMWLKIPTGNFFYSDIQTIKITNAFWILNVQFTV